MELFPSEYVPLSGGLWKFSCNSNLYILNDGSTYANTCLLTECSIPSQYVKLRDSHDLGCLRKWQISLTPEVNSTLLSNMDGFSLNFFSRTQIIQKLRRSIGKKGTFTEERHWWNMEQAYMESEVGRCGSTNIYE